MLKRKLNLKETSPMRCSECLYYKCQRKPGADVPCSKNGVKAYAKAPACFFPDISQLTHSIESFGALISVFSAYTPKQRRILVSLLSKSAKDSAKAHKFGSKVYFAIRGDGDYMSDWVSAYVLGYAQDGKVIVSGSPDRKSLGRSFTAYLDPDSVFTATQFEKKKEQMVAEQKIDNPNTKNLKRVATVDKNEPEIPTLDTAPHSWFDTYDRSSKEKKGSKDVYERILSNLKR